MKLGVLVDESEVFPFIAPVTVKLLVSKQSVPFKVVALTVVISAESKSIAPAVRVPWIVKLPVPPDNSVTSMAPDVI